MCGGGVDLGLDSGNGFVDRLDIQLHPALHLRHQHPHRQTPRHLTPPWFQLTDPLACSNLVHNGQMHCIHEAMLFSGSASFD